MMDRKRIESENIPTKRHDLKKSDTWSHLISSYGTYDSYRDCLIPFAEFCKERYGISKINRITKTMVKEYFDYKINTGKWKSEWTKHKNRSAISKLDSILKDRGWLSKNSEGFRCSSDELGLDDRKLKNRSKGGPYTSKEVEQIKEIVSDTAKEYITFVERIGARMEGCSTVKAKDIDIFEGKVRLKEKGGRIRYIELDDETVEYLKEKLDSLDPEEKILPEVTDRAVQKSIEKACEKLNIPCRGLHGVRGMSAMKIYEKLRSQGISESEANSAVSQYLGHNREDVVRNYMYD